MSNIEGGSGLWGIQGSNKLGIQYLCVEICVFGISVILFVLLTPNFGNKIYYVPFSVQFWVLFFGYISIPPPPPPPTPHRTLRE